MTFHGCGGILCPFYTVRGRRSRGMSAVGANVGRMTIKRPPHIAQLVPITTTAELKSTGLSADQISGMTQRGQLIRVGRGFYATDRSAPDRIGGDLLQIAGALHALGSAAVASHHSAALIHGLDLVGKPPPSIAVTRPPGFGSKTARPGIKLHQARLPADHVTVAKGLPVTTTARTVVDLARQSPFTAGVVVADSALRRKQATKAELVRTVAACRRWPGVVRAAAVVDFADALAESVLESIARVVFRDCGLPPPQLQVWVGGDGFVIARVDFLWSQYATIAEVDGALKYEDKGRAVAQLRRDARLREAGFEVVHFGWQEITLAPLQVAESIRAAFERAKRLGRGSGQVTRMAAAPRRDVAPARK